MIGTFFHQSQAYLLAYSYCPPRRCIVVRPRRGSISLWRGSLVRIDVFTSPLRLLLCTLAMPLNQTAQDRFHLFQQKKPPRL